MERQIVTHPLAKEQIYLELEFLAQYLATVGYQKCEILFGFAWGNEYYNTDSWEYETIELDRLVSVVESVEAKDFGELGYNDLFIRITGQSFEFRFCNDTDIHIDFSESNEIVEYFYNRWKDIGYSPSEWGPDEADTKKRVQLR